MPSAVNLKRMLMRYKKALKPTIGRVGAVPLQDLIINVQLLGMQPLPGNVGNKQRLRQQISRRMRSLDMGSILCLRKHELVALHGQLLAYAQAMGGPPGDSNDPRWLPIDLDNMSGALGLAN